MLFYFKDLTRETNFFSISPEESKHISKVLRKKEGEVLKFTNGAGFLFETVISQLGKKIELQILNVKEYPKKKTHQLHIAIAPTKNIDRLEWFLEKSTEIGIDKITPILCDHSERKVIKHDRLEKIIISAMKQSMDYHLPKLETLTAFRDVVENCKETNKLIAHCEDGFQKNNIFEMADKNSSNLVLIGPEGDFSKKEIDLALEKSFKPISLGTKRLRTETAGVVTSTCFSLI